MVKVMMLLMSVLSGLLSVVTHANDPTRPPHWMAAPATSAPPFNPANYELQQIIQHPQRQTAVINGQLLRVGDDIDGARLVRIEATSVVLRVRRHDHRLSLLSGDKQHEQ